MSAIDEMKQSFKCVTNDSNEKEITHDKIEDVIKNLNIQNTVQEKCKVIRQFINNYYKCSISDKLESKIYNKHKTIWITESIGDYKNKDWVMVYRVGYVDIDAEGYVVFKSFEDIIKRITQFSSLDEFLQDCSEYIHEE